MLVNCPQCRAEFRLREIPPGEREFNYLCPECERIVQIDLVRDTADPLPAGGPPSIAEKRPKVLIADDSETILGMADGLLTEAGFRVLTATDGVAALRAIESEQPHAVLLDLLMPKMTGFDVLREMKNDPRMAKIPVVIMSGVYKENVVGFLRKIGAAGFLDKENLRESLVFRVRSILQEIPAD